MAPVVFWCGLRKKSVCYNSYNGDGSSGPWILNGLLRALSTNVGSSRDESGMATDILF